MGKIPWDVIRRNIPRRPRNRVPRAGRSSDRRRRQQLGALRAGRRRAHCAGAAFDAELFAVERERQLLQMMIDHGPLVDGVTKQKTATVDGLSWEQYAAPLEQIGAPVDGGDQSFGLIPMGRIGPIRPIRPISARDRNRTL